MGRIYDPPFHGPVVRRFIDNYCLEPPTEAVLSAGLNVINQPQTNVEGFQIRLHHHKFFWCIRS